MAEPQANKHTQIGNAILNIESVRLNLKTQVCHISDIYELLRRSKLYSDFKIV